MVIKYMRMPLTENAAYKETIGNRQNFRFLSEKHKWKMLFDRPRHRFIFLAI
jgi:hypothetical protein